MNDDKKNENADLAPCLLERWLSEGHAPVFDTSETEGLEKVLDDVIDTFNPKLIDALYKEIKGICGLKLFVTLRGLHIVLASQLGLIEEWLRVTIIRDIPELATELVDEERDRLLKSAIEHVRSHMLPEDLAEIEKKERGESEEDEEDEDRVDDESSMIH